ncbi:MAG: 30S ribosomal protein S17 [Christensenellaceae bacterium]|jgi:small subunit ribosomal protein S17|nr:30S ribosomal protein S17 [Christensenellaceae bacterium]
MGNEERSVGRNSRRVLRGIVVSSKMDKTRVAAIERNVTHPLYKKVVKKTTKFKFHDENNESKTGDLVEIMETRHLSRDKYFRLVKIVEVAK